VDATIGLIAGSGWASGVNLYAVIALLGVFGRSGYGDQVPEVLTRPEVIGVAAVLYAVEFLADKVPYLDNLWDALHTVVRPIGAAVLGVLLAGDAETLQQAVAGVASGGLALASHSAKATARAAINTSPEPASNIVVSLLEDGLVAAVVWLAVEHPWVAAAAVVLLLVLGMVIVVTAWRAIGRLRTRLRERREARHRAPA
jgi:hypothetical protein